MNELRQLIASHQNRGAMIYSSEYKEIISPEQFQINYWRKSGSEQLIAKGRSETYKVSLSNTSHVWVLRDYYRGGVVGKLIERSYFFNSETNVRSFSEWRLLKYLYTQGLSVPKPIAAIYWRNGFKYQAAILTQYIDNSSPLSSHLLDNKEIPWEKIAGVIKQLHSLNCVHGDLNTHNILLHDNDVSLIDFDKSYISNKNIKALQTKNLLRLKRSLLKVTNWPAEKLEDNWSDFMRFYKSA